MPGNYYVDETKHRGLLMVAVGVLPGHVSAASHVLPQRLARSMCIGRIVRDAHAAAASQLVFELDETLVRADRLDVVATERSAGITAPPYRHMRASEEPLLCVADAFAWAWAKGGEWRKLVAEAVDNVIRVD